MTSIAHQWLLLWIVRKMAADGFIVTACDGRLPQAGLWNVLPRPHEFAGLRPDAFGIARITGELAFGEAKTYQDIETPHTRKQLLAFGFYRRANGESLSRVYVAVPRSAAGVLDRVLGKTGLLGASNIIRLHIPDCFLKEESI